MVKDVRQKRWAEDVKRNVIRRGVGFKRAELVQVRLPGPRSADWRQDRDDRSLTCRMIKQLRVEYPYIDFLMEAFVMGE